MQTFFNSKPVKLFITLFQKYAIYLFALVVVVLNCSLAFDNVVWGDEAFSGITIRNTNLYGIFERVYYLDSHPPLYYYWLRLLADIFGYNTTVYHFSALIPFIAGILIAIFLFNKKFGQIPTAFFITISGLSAVCAEYNLEIRMYALLFLELLICSYSAYRITENNAKKRHWVLLTLFGVFAAYTHYFGLVTSSILLFITSLFYFIRNRKKSWLYGLFSIISYIILYTPWLFVFYKQASTVSKSWWLTEIAPLSVLTEVLFCGSHMRIVLMPLTLLLSVFILLVESNILSSTDNNDKKHVTFSFKNATYKHWSNELKGIILFWCSIIMTIVCTYIASYLINPLTVARYMYPLIPQMLFILMLGIRRILAYGHVHWGTQEYYNSPNELPTGLFATENKKKLRVCFSLITVVFLIILTIGLFDFKYYRSVSKTQNAQTEFILYTIGEPTEDTVFTAANVQHLSWTVLQYYFPNNPIYACMPNEVQEDADHIWTFLGNDISESTLDAMESKGYSVNEYKAVLMCKYSCNVYHFYKD